MQGQVFTGHRLDNHSPDPASSVTSFTHTPEHSSDEIVQSVGEEETGSSSDEVDESRAHPPSTYLRWYEPECSQQLRDNINISLYAIHVVLQIQLSLAGYT